MSGQLPPLKKSGMGRFSEAFMGLGMLGILFVLLVPMPAIALDLAITLNLTAAVMVLLITLSVKRPLEFNTFPSLLLFTTLYRLALNVASTRMILSEGSAGEVISSFGDFVVAGDLVVGLVIFLILVIIQFVVITKGSNRISEVAARFTLDAMPGKQMAIDADLNAGLITEEQARERRETIASEAEFYGAMDGAGKFVRGDAIAGLIITLVNIIGGVAIGVANGGSIAGALQQYAILTVGDGLVSQVPALVIAVSAGVLVTKARSDIALSEELADQFLLNTGPIKVGAAMLAAVGLVPGLPTLPFLTLAALAFTVAKVADRNVKEEETEVVDPVEKAEEASSASEVTPEVLHEILRVDRLGIEIGYRLIPLVDQSKRGNLLDHIAMVRKQFAQTLGFVVPPIRMRDNLGIDPNAYRILIGGQEVGRGELYPDHVLAMNPGGIERRLSGIDTTDPTFGLPATWVPRDAQAEAEAEGFTVVDPESVLVTHLTEVLKEHGDEILDREDVQALLDRVKEHHPTVVGELVPEVLTIGQVQAVLARLLRERIPVRNIVTILETLADEGRNQKDPDVLADAVRARLSRTLCQLYGNADGRLEVLTLAPQLETQLMESVRGSESGPGAAALHQAQEAVLTAWQKAQAGGREPVLLVRAPLRRHLAELFRGVKPPIPVLSFNEVVSAKGVESLGLVQPVAPDRETKVGMAAG